MVLSWQYRQSRQKSKGAKREGCSVWRFRPRLEVLEQRLAPAALVVNTSVDEDDAQNVTNQPPAGPDGLLSLREAIEWVDKMGAGTTTSISFSVQQVKVASELRSIDFPINISGTGVEISPADPAHAPVFGLGFTTGGNHVAGLTIHGFTEQLSFGFGNGNFIEGNFIGTNPDGTAAVGGRYGIFINLSNDNKIVGNVVSGVGDGIIIGSNASGNLVTGNFIGTDKSGSKALGNSGNGIIIDGANGNTIGGTSSSDLNVISGNAGDGILIRGQGSGNFASSGNLVEGNYIGTDVSGSKAIPNTGSGIVVYDYVGSPSGNTIGGTSAGAGNIVSGNSSDGVYLVGRKVSKTQVLGNYIGLNAAGTAPLGNAFSGVEISDAMMNTVGGAIAAARNIISGNTTGIYVHSTAASLGAGNVIAGNFIGTDKSGIRPLGNKGSGAYIASAGNTIGGTTIGSGNVVSGNSGDGVDLNGSTATHNQVQGNHIGLDDSGTAALPNHGTGVSIFNAGMNTIGGTAVGAGNVISGNNGDGVYLNGGAASGNQVQGNDIGLNASDTAALANAINGVEILDAPMNTIGGTAAADRNVISANVGAGVYIHSSAGTVSTRDLVAGNSLGTDKGGNSAFGNAYGVFIAGASNNSIGGTTPGAGNIIAFNKSSGVVVGASTTDQAVGNAIRQNSIYDNKRVGIDLGNDGITLNHEGNAASGPNQLQNHPVLASLNGAIAEFELRGKPNTQYQLDFFSNTQADPSWYGQGQKFLRSDVKTTDGNGYVKFNENLPAAQFITATATDSSGNTSEFSSYVTVDNVRGALPATKNPVTGTRPAAQGFTTTNSGLDFQPALAADLLVVVENAGQINIATNGLNVAGAPIRWQIDRNPTDAVGVKTSLPSLSSQTGDSTIVTPNVPGSFRLICYLDADGNGKFEVGEELKVLRIAIIRATIQPGFSITQDHVGWGAPEANGVSPTGDAMKFQAKVLLEGGGSNEMLGVSQLVLGEVGNVIGDTFKINYPGTAANSHAATGSEDPDYKINSAPGFANPMLDSLRVALGGQGQGAQSPFRSSSAQTDVGPGPGGHGLIREVTATDTPSVGWDYNHPATTNPWGTTSGNNQFREYLVIFSPTFNKNYMVLARGGYTISFVGNNMAGLWHNTGSTDSIQPLTATGFPQTGDSAGIQVLGYSFVREFGINYTVPTSGTSAGGFSTETRSLFATGDASLSILFSSNATPLHPAQPGARTGPPGLSTGSAASEAPDIASAGVAVLRRLHAVASRPAPGAWDDLDRFFAQEVPT
jgi:hypothetical protein